MLTPLNDDDPTAVGPYRLQSRIGAGGMGVVYLGFGPDGRAVAIKLVAPQFGSDPEFRARFRREVSAARAVRGSRIAAVLDADPDGVQPWMATEYVEGTSLAQAVTTGGCLDERLLTGLAAGLADALVAVHAAGVVHRDLKPANILLAWDGPKVIDFGIASTEEATRHTRTGMLIGTLVWMAPEQLLGKRAGAPADVFAWGACMAYAATGRPPFRGDRPEAIGFQIISGEPDLEGVPAGLVGVVRDALSKDPAHRPTAAGIVARLAAGGRADPGASGTAVTSVAEADRVADSLLGQWRTSSAPPSAPPQVPAGRVGPPHRAAHTGWDGHYGWTGRNGPGAPPTVAEPRNRMRAALLPAILVLLVGAMVAAAVLVVQSRDPATVATGSQESAAPPTAPAATTTAAQTAPPATTPPATTPPADRTPPATRTPQATTPAGTRAGLTRAEAEAVVAEKRYAVVDSSYFSDDKFLNVIIGSAQDITVAVFRYVTALPLSVMQLLRRAVTSCYLLPGLGWSAGSGDGCEPGAVVVPPCPGLVASPP